jgi:UDP-glucose:(heptosyl)LPS alpha-1,3-glucosyltransferase
MKIALVRKDYTRRKGGAEGYVVSLSKQLATMGHEVHVFANRIETDETNGVSFHRVPIPGLRTFLRHVWFAKNAEKMLREEEYDIINGLSRIWYQDIYRIGDPLFIHWLQCHPPNFIDRVLGHLNPKQRTMLSLEKRIFRSPMLRRTIAISRLDCDLLQRYYSVPPGKIRVIYNGVNHGRFNPGNRKFRSEVLAGFGVPENKTVLLFVGMDFKRKGLAHLIAALERLGTELRCVHCLILSNDNPKKYVQQAQKLRVDGSITFAAATPDVEKVYGAADIFVFPTLYDPFANVHLEALASGVPVITTAAAGGAEVIDDGKNGFVLREAQDTESMAQRILELLNPVNRRRMSEEAVESVKDFTVERNAREVAALYEEVHLEKSG